MMDLAGRVVVGVLVVGLAAGLACSASPADAPSQKDVAHMTGNLTRELGGPLTEPLLAAQATRLFFAHHSVGRHLLSGVQRLAAEAGAGPKVVDLGDAAAASGPVWLHGSGGSNGDPRSKIDYFLTTLQAKATAGDHPVHLPVVKADLAFMKFCYVDFNPRTDVDGLLAYYKDAIARLKKDRPDLKLAHVTVPLTVRPRELKWRVFRLLGREVWEDAANVKRQEFNEKLVQLFPSDPIFDLARVESTRPDGSRTAFEERGRTYHSLEPAYAADNGHLNALGERVAGAEMIRFVARTMTGPSANN